MNEGLSEAHYMTTPFEDSVLESLVPALEEAAVAPEMIEALGTAFSAEKLPSADGLLQLIKEYSGDRTA